MKRTPLRTAFVDIVRFRKCAPRVSGDGGVVDPLPRRGPHHLSALAGADPPGVDDVLNTGVGRLSEELGEVTVISKRKGDLQ